MFWRETLEHAKDTKAVAVLVITNDRKNDWYMGGSDSSTVDTALRRLRTDWKPVPNPHPMLAMEAKLYSGVQCLELLDTAYLAALLRDLSEEQVRAFVDVAIVPDDPTAGRTQRGAATSADQGRSTEPDEERSPASEAFPLFPRRAGCTKYASDTYAGVV